MNRFRNIYKISSLQHRGLSGNVTTASMCYTIMTYAYTRTLPLSAKKKKKKTCTPARYTAVNSSSSTDTYRSLQASAICNCLRVYVYMCVWSVDRNSRDDRYAHTLGTLFSPSVSGRGSAAIQFCFDPARMRLSLLPTLRERESFS